VSITSRLPLTTMPPRFITIRRPIITILASTKRRKRTQPRPRSTAKWRRNTPRLRSIILKNDDGTMRVLKHGQQAHRAS